MSLTGVSREGFGRYVWTPDPVNGFMLGKLCDIGTDTMTVELVDTNKIVTAPYDQVFPAEEDRHKDVDDNCALMYLNEGTFLNNCRIRYARKQIYTYVANILISINPYEQIPELYSSGMIQKYQAKSLGTLPPHIFAIADKVYRDMRRFKESQSVIVSGESGAGKTESQKYILRYLCESWSSGSGPIEQRILETNPILEAFGNAKTLRNNNSSRFGKFVEIHFNPKYFVAGGYVSHYLLEKSRICLQQSDERNYHIFYQLIAGADDNLAKHFGLAPPDFFHYLNKGCTQFFAKPSTSAKIQQERRGKKKADLRDELLDDYADFQSLKKALLSIGIPEKTMYQIFQTVAAVLQLGNIQFEENADDRTGACMVSESSEYSLSIASKLLGLDAADLRHGMLFRVMQPTRGGDKGTIIRVPLKPYEAAAARDALAKAVYSRMFDSIVAAINKCIPFGDSVSYIGVLDIAGFEFFTVNSFEQFCINYCNEKLQKFFNDRILKQEQELYAKEYLNVPRIEYCDNQDCLELFEEKIYGLLDMLDEEARLPRPSAKHYTAHAHHQLKDHFRLSTPRKSKLREHREILDDEGFLIRHFAGAVCYDTTQFLEKNNDALHASLEILIQQSSNSYIQKLFMTEYNGIPKAENRSKASAGKLAFASVSYKFKVQLNELLERLKNTGTHFVRCIKPNSIMKAGKFEGAQILSQLKCAGMASVLKLMQKGYPSRTTFSDLYGMYKKLLPPELSRLDSRLFCKCLFGALGLNDKDFKFGLTKVFFRPGKFAEFDQMLHQDKEHMKKLIRKVQAWLRRIRWKKVQYGVLSCIKLKNKILYRAHALIIIQSATRGFLARKTQTPRLQAYSKAVNVIKTTNELLTIMRDVSPNNQRKWAPIINSLKNEAERLAIDVKTSPIVNIQQFKEQHNLIQKKIASTTTALKADVQSDKNVKIQKMENDLKAKEISKKREEQKAKELTLQKEQRRLLEEKRVKEEEEYLLREAFVEEQRLIEEELRLQRERKAEQERLDAELVRRLAQEDRRVHFIENSSPEMESKKQETRYNLSKWRYADLRDAINTSNDIDLLTACRDEFYRRMQVYQQWKQKTDNKQQKLRAPASVINAATNIPATTQSSSCQSNEIQRYFKVPFSQPAEKQKHFLGFLDRNTSKEGLWYAHFDGQWIARQMEIHPNKSPVLLIAGRNDVDMCELPLDVTKLTRKKGAEILEDEFESLWQLYGGPPYQRGSAPTRRKRLNLL